MGAGQILAHLVGDYLLQSEWMARGKTKHWGPALAHGACYTLPFLLLTHSWWRLAIIGGSHIAIDRWRLSYCVAWASNFLAPKKDWPSKKTLWGLDPSSWLRVVIDNTVHLLINAIALAI